MPTLSLLVDAPALSKWMAILLAYLLGAIPFGLLLANMKGVDLRRIGSGNIGATNTVRALGKGWGGLSFLLDVGKGWFPAFVLAPWLAEGLGTLPLQVACGAAATLGHCFPVYLRFKGGKGVATGCGAFIAIDPIIFLLAGVVWLVTLFTTRFVGLSSILMGVTFPLTAAWRREPGSSWARVIGGILLTLLILVRHRTNIARMVAGTEPKSGASKPNS